MKKRSLLLAIVAIMLTASLGTTIVAHAGINTNNPFGDGLIKNGSISSADFITFDDETNPAITAKTGNGTLLLSGGTASAASVITHNNAIPKSDLVDGTKVVIQYDIYKLGAMWSQVFYVHPFHNKRGLESGTNYMWMRINVNCVQNLTIPSGAEVWINGGKIDPADFALVGTDGGKHSGDFGLQANVYNAQIAKGNDHCTYWLEYDITTKDLVIYGGNADTNEKTAYATVKNAFTLDESLENYYMNFAYTQDLEMDNVKIYLVNGEETKYYLNCGFDSKDDYMIGGSDAEADKMKLVLDDRGEKSSLKTYDTVVRFTKPSNDARITTTNKLAVDTKLTKTFELDATYRLATMNAGRKIGIALGLDSYRTTLDAPKNGASFVYLTVNEAGKVILGAQNIAEDGTSAEIGTAVVLEGLTATSDVALHIEGRKNGSVDVKVGENVYNFEGIKANGHVSFVQTGSGDVDYSLIVANVKLTGYELKENEGVAQTASFDNNYISTSKFTLQSTTAPESYLTKQETSTHKAEGVVTDNGKIGFYGTSTNTRLMFKEQYADFVLQFDYISEPVANRYLPAGLPTSPEGVPNRYSPFFVLIGAENDCPELAQAYAYGIVEGNMTQYFWGAESLINREGKARAEGGSVTVTAGMTKLTANEEGAIPCYFAPNGTVEYGKPADGALYSFYNKTTRIKFVVINNHVAMYAAEVSAEGTVGTYVKIFEDKVTNSMGNVGFGTDSPGWAAIDNVAITPISTDAAIEAGVDAVPAVDLVADVAVSAMENDEEPKPLAKAVVTVNQEEKKATWEAVTGAKEYEVVVKLGTETVIKKTIKDTFIDLSELTAEGDYKIRVTAVPEDEENFLRSNSLEVTYTVKKTVAPDSSSSADGNSSSGSTTDGGSCSSCNGFVSVGGAFAMLSLIGAAIVIRKSRKED